MKNKLLIKIGSEIIAPEHYHKTMHEYFYILDGQLSVKVGNSEHNFQKDDLFVIEPGETHLVTYTSEDLKLLLIMPPPVKDDKIIV